MNGPFRTLFIVRHPPYPPVGGAALRNWQNINILSDFGPVDVMSIQYGDIGQSPPGVSYWISFDVSSLLKQRPLAKMIASRLWWLRPSGHPEMDRLHAARVSRKMRELLISHHYSLVIFEELWVYPYLRTVKEFGCRSIFDAHNVEGFLRDEIRDAVPTAGTLRKRAKAFLLGAHIKSLERAFCAQVDQVWVCSPQDAARLRTLYGTPLAARVIPNGVDPQAYECVRGGNCPPPDGTDYPRETMAYSGVFEYAPNSAAAGLLINQILPSLRKRHPHCRLLLVGKAPTQSMQAAARNDSGIVVTGTVPDVRPYLAAASVVVVPLPIGGGTRLKILEAFAAGRPVVSTSKGADGLDVRDGEHLLIRDGVENIVAAVSQLWSEPSLCQRLTRSAYDLLQQRYSWTAVSREVGEALRQLP